jgi:ABC-type branched-subunit amino acid transport system ATPase component/ABC-type branched-subunit amino acid transport system permease subunit
MELSGKPEAKAGGTTRLRDLLSSRRATLLKLAVVVILLAWPPFVKGQFSLSVMTTAGLFMMLTISVWIILGTAGQLSFGHSAFYGIGAYTTGLLCVKYSVSTLVALLAGTLAAGFVALVIGRPVLKLRYFYLAFATIGIGQIFVVLVTNLVGYTGGLNGFSGIPPLNLGFFSADSYIRKYYVVWITALLILLFIDRAMKYRVGRSFRALATSEIASSSLGVRTDRWKLLAFVTSALICGISGGLFAFVMNAVSPNSFTFNASILPIVMMMIGGERTVWGAIIGAIIMTWVVNGLTSIQEWSGVAYSLILILLLLFLPTGLLSGLRPSQKAWLLSLFKREKLREPALAAGALTLSEEEASGEVHPAVRSPQAVPVDMGTAQPQPVSGASSEVAASGSVSGSTTGEPLMMVEDLTIAFGGLKAVNEVSLAVYEGRITALIGPNGAGKTTLFNGVSRLQRLTRGMITFAGEDITDLSAAEAARRGLARTFQTLRIFSNMSVLDNVLMGCHRHERSGFWAGGLGLPHHRAEERKSREQAMAALTAVGLQDKAMVQAADLPYGQQRLVEIARALASQPRLLLLDEPAAGMNAAERAHLIDRITHIRDSGITVLLVEHDIDLVMDISNQVYVLDYGRLIATGKPEEVQRDPAVVEAYLGMEQERGVDRCPTRGLADGTCPEPANLLVVEDVYTYYGLIEALHGVSLFVPEGEIVAVLGANGAGKSTLLRTISGLLRASKGSIHYEGADITKTPAEKIVARRLCQVLEGRQLFPTLTVEDNLVMGASGRSERLAQLADDLNYVYELFPTLAERRRQTAGSLSGGEQQMVAIGRGLMGRPKLLLLDEPSMGLAPLLVERIFEALATLNANGLTMLMVEQNAELALSIAHRAVLLRTGSVVLSGVATELRRSDRVLSGYLGQSSG